MINLKAFAPEEPKVQDDEMAFGIVEAVFTLDGVLAESEDILRSVATVEEIKESITGREIGSSMLAYAGESIGQIAPSFVEGNSEEAVEQMEETLKDFGAKIMKLIKKILSAIGNFFKKLLPFLRGTGEKIDLLTTKLSGSKVEWKKKEGVINVYNNVDKIVSSVTVVVELLENVLDVVSSGSTIKPADFKDWDTMVKISKGEGEYDIEKNKADLGKEEKQKSEVAPSQILEKRDWRTIDSMNKKLGKLIPRIEKFVKKSVDTLEYDKDAFATFKVSPAEAIQGLAKYSRTFVGLLGGYLNDTLKALKQMAPAKEEK